MDGEKKPGSDSVDARSWGKEALNPIKSQLMQEEIEQEKVRNVNPSSSQRGSGSSLEPFSAAR